MSIEENKKVVRRWNAVLWDENVSVDTFDELLHPDYANRSNDSPPWSVGVKGVTELKKLAAHRRGRLANLDNVIEDLIAEGDRVAARITGVLNGKPITRVMAFYRLVDGKIIDDWFTWVDIPESADEQVPAETAEA